MQGYSGDLSKIYFPWLSRPLENLGGLQPGFLWFLMLMSLLLLVWQELHHNCGLGQTKGASCDSRIQLHISEENKNSVFIRVFLSHCGVCCHKEGRNEEEDEIFQVQLFLSTSLFQKSETTRCIMVSGCFELLQLLNGSSLPNPQNCFIVVLKLCLSHWVGCWVICFLNLHFTLK